MSFHWLIYLSTKDYKHTHIERVELEGKGSFVFNPIIYIYIKVHFEFERNKKWRDIRMIKKTSSMKRNYNVIVACIDLLCETIRTNESVFFLATIYIHWSSKCVKLYSNCKKKRDDEHIWFIKLIYMQITLYWYSMTTLARTSTGTTSIINLILYANIGV
jgi:hypothetical protein